MEHEDIKQRFRTHLIAFISILVLAMMSAGTVLIGTPNRSAVLAIAGVQVLIVLASMMHAHREGPWIKWLIAFSVVNVSGLAGALYVGYFDTVAGTERVMVAAPEHGAEGATETEHESTDSGH